VGFFVGGKDANQVVQAAKLEAESFMIGAVGNDDNGKFLLSSLSSIGPLYRRGWIVSMWIVTMITR
jgi:sugar/nucleoside kinase (ribokinase family)